MLNYYNNFVQNIKTFKWSPTPEDVEKAEKKMLSVIKTPYEQKFIEFGEHKINTIKMGQGEPLVLIHGFGAGIGFWIGNLDFLAKHYTVYAIDLPGFARSSRPDPKTIQTIDDAEKYWTETIDGWAKEVGVDKFHLLGHSLGGYVSACYTMQHPERVKTLILCDGWGVSVKPVDYEQNLSFKAKVLSRLFSIDISLGIVRNIGPKLISKFRQDLLAKFGHLHPVAPKDESINAIADYVYHSNSQVPATGEHLFRLVSLPLGWAARPLYHRLKDIDPSIDISFIYGEYSWIDPNQGIQLEKELDNVKSVHIIQNSGHHVYIDNLPQFHDSILKIIPKPNLPESKLYKEFISQKEEIGHETQAPSGFNV